jgi:hypothetical protein
MGKKEYFNTNNILRDEYSQRINLYSPNLPNPYQRKYATPYTVHHQMCITRGRNGKTFAMMRSE